MDGSLLFDRTHSWLASNYLDPDYFRDRILSGKNSRKNRRISVKSNSDANAVVLDGDLFDDLALVAAFPRYTLANG